MASSSKRFEKVVETLERNSDRLIPRSCYYAVLIMGDVELKTLRLWGRTFLSKNRANLPLFTYTTMGCLTLLFPQAEDSHYLGGGHHSIISSYVTAVLSLSPSINVRCSIVEFASKTQVFTYFTYKVWCSLKAFYSQYLSSSQVRSLTNGEMTKELKKQGVDADAVHNSDKYGIFYRLIAEGDKIKVASMYEAIDARNGAKYLSFMFG